MRVHLRNKEIYKSAWFVSHTCGDTAWAFESKRHYAKFSSNMVKTSIFHNKLELTLFLIGIVLSLLMFKTLMIHTDNTQLMDKVMQIKTTGEWVHHGNATTKMGALPGSFLTFFTAVPMLIWFSPYAACAVILLCHILAYFILRRIGYKLDANFNPLLLVIFFWLNPWRVEQSELYNPGYLFLFAAIHFLSVLELHEKPKSFWASFWLAVGMGFCFQVHFSVLILGISFLYLFFTKKIKVNYAGIATGVFVVGLSLIPWLLQTLAQDNTVLKPASDTFLGKNLLLVYPVLKAVIYFFRMGSVYFGRHIFSEIRFDWITVEWLKASLDLLFHNLKWILGALSLYLSTRFFILQFRHYKKEFSVRPFIDHYLVSLFLGVIGAAALSPVEFNHWHFILCLPAILFYLSLKPEVYFTKAWTGFRHKVLVAVAVLFVVWNLFAGLGSRSHSFKNDYHRDFMQHYELTSSESK